MHIVVYLIDKLLQDVEPLNFHQQIASFRLGVMFHLGRNNLFNQLHQLLLLGQVQHFLGKNIQIIKMEILTKFPAER